MKSAVKFFFVLTILLVTIKTNAQNPVKEIGVITSTIVSTQSIDITTPSAFASVIAYSPNIIRVRVDKQKLKPDFSYAVIAPPQTVKTTITQNDSSIILQTDSLKAEIKKNPFSIIFYNKEGKIISQDEQGLNISWVGEEVSDYKKMQDDERFIGLGEKTGNLDRRGSGYTNWNSDVPGYSASQDPLYSSIPFYIGIHHNLNYGIFLDNTFQTDFNFGASNDRFSSFGARGGELNYYFIYHTKLSDIISSYTSLTGRMKMPPMWSLGYQQCRWSYYPDTEVIRIAQTMREKKIPCDGITLDIHYMDKYQLFTWDKNRFSDPVSLTGNLKSLGFRTTVIVDPGIKVAPGAPAFERGLQQDAYVKYVDGKYYSGQVWPGWCYFTDFTSEKGRAFWRKEVKFFPDNGVSGIWNDMNEIATWGQKMPNNIIFDFEGRKASHLEARNVYGFLMARSSNEGYKEATNKRPFVLSRAGYAGLQRYSAIWTGDNVASDEHMILGVRLLNSLGLSGVSFTGMDVGGYTGGSASPELFTRWMQLGAFFPYYRNHKEYNNRSSEPWTYGEEAIANLRPFVNLRYKLLPYLYAAFYESTQDGLPVIRSLAIENTFDANVYDKTYQNQFCFGNALMVAPVVSTKDFAKIYFPKSSWYDLFNDSVEQGGKEKIIQLSMKELPVYVKESSIIPTQSLVQSTAYSPSDTLIIHVYKGNQSNNFIYYEDDGESFEYEKGNYYKRNISYDPSQKSIVIDKPEGSFTSKFKSIQLVFHGFTGVEKLRIDDQRVAFKRAQYSFLTDNSTAIAGEHSCNVLIAVFKNANNKIVIKY
ncbi:glycoside hydrolase family 31 protein [Ferruginibacter albus]|uniref:glycoside hydrolase family 31 protein n=1 Tax=Ferruginibacter albus TaxID=2875540 RepID=UPI001CC3BFF1|nr:glycoside hydrolase family 31 protein [Ferruginibacter albus]UAY51603.1 glycoside hydrolase family 31 protein [Ferruginibacter albus]